MDDIDAEIEALLAGEEGIEGGEAEPMLEDPMMEEELPMEGGTDIQANLAALPPEAQQGVAMHMTPENIQVMAWVFGEETAAPLREMADPNLMLVPMPREQAMAIAQEAQGQQAAPAGPAPAGPAPSAPPPGPSGPPTGPLA